MKLLGSAFEGLPLASQGVLLYSFLLMTQFWFFFPQAACGDLDETYINYAEEKTQKCVLLILRYDPWNILWAAINIFLFC